MKKKHFLVVSRHLCQGIGPFVVREPPQPPAKFFLSHSLTFYNYESIRVWKRIRLFYQIAPVLKSTEALGIFYKRGGPNPGPQDRVPETRAPAKFYVTLWLQFVVRRHVCWQHQCVRLGVMGRANPQTKRFLVQFQKNAYTVVNWFSGKLVKLLPPDVRF